MHRAILYCGRTCAVIVCNHNSWQSYFWGKINAFLFLESPDVRLVGGNSPLEGRVEIRYNDSWITLCDTMWTAEDAKVVCRMLGSIKPSVGPLSASYFGASTGNILMVIIVPYFYFQILSVCCIFVVQGDLLTLHPC